HGTGTPEVSFGERVVALQCRPTPARSRLVLSRAYRREGEAPAEPHPWHGHCTPSRGSAPHQQRTRAALADCHRHYWD
ncbi:MAG: hypothetical protein ACKO2P_19100, partial [Planctomycetota bacterium]